MELEPMLDEYYRARGWDVETGLPTKEKLEELGLVGWYALRAGRLVNWYLCKKLG